MVLGTHTAAVYWRQDFLPPNMNVTMKQWNGTNWTEWCYIKYCKK